MKAYSEIDRNIFRASQRAACSSALTRAIRASRSFAILLVLGFAAASVSAMASTTQKCKSKKPAIVMVHGAWADGSSWNDVVSRLQAKGYSVTSVQIPLSSLAEDVAVVRRTLEMQEGPVVLVGHSWGGAVITQAGGDKKVAALVYITAFAPDAGQSVNDLQRDFPAPEYSTILKIDSGGYLHFPQESLPGFFAQDLPIVNARVLAATQKPILASAFDDKVTEAAWHQKPAWYLVTEQDRMIYPKLQRDMAQRISATVRQVRSSHVPFLTHPKETTAIILDAVYDACSRANQ